MIVSLFSYVVVQDSGFAPNPYAGVLTLATCKPRIRARAHSGDWLVGTGSVHGVGANRVVYAAAVMEVIPIEVYGAIPQFQEKIPSVSGTEWQLHGDNLYFRNELNEWQQRRNSHHAAKHIARDLSGVNVLICREFWYFGREAPSLPGDLLQIAKRGPGHKRIEDPDIMTALRGWLSRYPNGISGEPFIIRASRAN